MTASEPDAVRYCLRLLSYRGRSVRELRERLRDKGYDEAVVEAALARLSAAGYLDDHLLARNLARLAAEQRLLGNSAARQFLRKRGIDEEVINATLVTDEEAELALCLRLAGKRARVAGMPGTPQEKNRLFQYLARRGYGPDIIRRAMRELGRDPEV